MDTIVYKNLRDIRSDTNNLRLKIIQESDTENIVRWRNNEAIRSHFIFRELFTYEMHKKWLEDKVYTGKVIQYIIETNDIPIGSVYIRDIDTNNECGEFGIFIGDPLYISKGLGTKITKLIVSYCFELGFHRIYLRVLDDNKIAIKSYLKAGFVLDGIAKDMVRINGNWHDVLFMSVINN